MDEHDDPRLRDDALARRLRQHWDSATPRLDQRAAWRRLQAQLPPPRRRWLDWQALWRPALTFAGGMACAVLVLALLPGRTPAPPPAQDFAPLSAPANAPAAGTDRVQLQVAFASEARIAEVNALLQALDAAIVAGPSALGLYTVAVARPRAPQTLDALRASPLVDSADPVPET
ncbi:hypothetical protein [Thermomonas flagellata]|uniref:hypothetical protein n=1 Tax=Thermomonas flagellata TaxID=2888524 RepID=UPI001F0346A7|nr:hypothetical protein [Thermomonas flagellata]